MLPGGLGNSIYITYCPPVGRKGGRGEEGGAETPIIPFFLVANSFRRRFMRTTIILFASNNDLRISLQFSAAIAHLTVHNSQNEYGHRTTVEYIAARFPVNATPPVPWILSPIFPPIAPPPRLSSRWIPRFFLPSCTTLAFGRDIRCRLLFAAMSLSTVLAPDLGLSFGVVDWCLSCKVERASLVRVWGQLIRNLGHTKRIRDYSARICRYSNFPGWALLESNPGSHNKGLVGFGSELA